jgi:hypothetical protein
MQTKATSLNQSTLKILSIKFPTQLMTPHPQFPLFPLALLIDVHDTNPSQIALLRHETELPDPVQVDNLFRLLLAQKVPVHLRM